MKAYLGRMGGTDQALEQDYSTIQVYDDGENRILLVFPRLENWNFSRKNGKSNIGSTMEQSWICATRIQMEKELPKDERKHGQNAYQNVEEKDSGHSRQR